MKKTLIFSCALVLLFIAKGVTALESPKELKESALASLENIAHADDWIAHKVDKAMKHLTKSLLDDLWQNEFDLTSDGKKVFQEDKKAVHELQKIQNNKKVAEDVKNDIQAIIGALVMADQFIASRVKATAIAVPHYLNCYSEDSVNPQCDKVLKEISKVDKEFQKAQAELDKEHADKAIEHYRKAWEHSQKAWEHAPKAPPFQFSFESASDELSVALKKVYEAYVTTPISGEQIQYLNQRRGEGIEYLRQHTNEAAAVIIGEASRMHPQDLTRQMVVIHLLGWLDSEAGVAFLHEQSGQTLPAAAANPGDESVSERDVALLLRRAAVSGLGRLRLQGSGGAQARLLELLGNTDMHLKQLAIKTYYDTARQRWRAKEEMSGRLAPETRYLLHEIY